jgi:serine O-acetyltransferase
MRQPKHLEVVPTEARALIWSQLRDEAARAAAVEPDLASLLNAVVLKHDRLDGALSYQLARKLGDQELRAMSVREICEDAFAADPRIVADAEADLRAVFERDPACKGYLQPFLFFKGFHALQSYRLAHWLWSRGRETLAFYLQSRMSELFQVDINPAAKIGKGVLLGAGAKVLGNITIGDYAKIASGSVVLKPVPPHCTAAGVPARLVNCPTCPEPARSMDHTLADVVYDYVI